jgi:hypothetical protein
MGFKRDGVGLGWISVALCALGDVEDEFKLCSCRGRRY